MALRAASLASTPTIIAAAPAVAAAVPLRAEIYQSQLGTTPVWIGTEGAGLPDDRGRPISPSSRSGPGR